MNEQEKRSMHSEEDELFAFGDAVAGNGRLQADTELEKTFLRVQRVLREPATAQASMPTQARQDIWRNIMATSPASGGRGVGRQRVVPVASPGLPAPPEQQPPRRIVPPRRMAWTGAAKAVMMLVLLVAGIAVWGLYGGDWFGDRGGEDPPSIPAIGTQLTIPNQGEPPTVAASPEDPVIAPFTPCDLSEDIPIFMDVSESPIGGTSLYLAGRDPLAGVVSGDLMLHCAEGENDMLLAENVTLVGPGPWPGTVWVFMLEEGSTNLNEVFFAIFDLRSGVAVDLAPAEFEEEHSRINIPGNPWVIGQSATDPNDRTIVDLRTMEATSLAALAGHQIAPTTRQVPATHPNSTTMAVDFSSYDLPGDILNLEEDAEDARWLDAPNSLRAEMGMWLSPDGSRLAIVDVTSYTEDLTKPEEISYVILSTDDGSVINRSEPIEYIDESFAVWTDDGEEIVFIDGTELVALSSSAGAEQRVVYETNEPIHYLATTYDPNIVVFQSFFLDVIYSVDIGMGAAHEFAGRDVKDTYPWFTQAGFLVMYQPQADAPETIDYAVYDPVSGEQIGTISDAPYPEIGPGTVPVLGKSSVGLTPDGTTEVIAFGPQQISVMQHTDDGPVFRTIRPPDSLDFATGTVYMNLSPDGSVLSLSVAQDEARARYLISLDDPDAEWIEVPSEIPGSDISLIQFVEGTGA